MNLPDLLNEPLKYIIYSMEMIIPESAKAEKNKYLRGMRLELTTAKTIMESSNR